MTAVPPLLSTFKYTARVSATTLATAAGHADTSQFEWCVNQQRDTYASFMGHFDMLNYVAISENETKGRVKFSMMEKMVQPCGPPPEKQEE